MDFKPICDMEHKSQWAGPKKLQLGSKNIWTEASLHYSVSELGPCYRILFTDWYFESISTPINLGREFVRGFLGTIINHPGDHERLSSAPTMFLVFINDTSVSYESGIYGSNWSSFISFTLKMLCHLKDGGGDESSNLGVKYSPQ